MDAYPNPFTHQLHIAYHVPQPQSASLMILNGLGQTVWEKETSVGQKEELNLDTANWSAGIYFLKLTTERKRYVYKLFKQP